eukprot:3272138-Rhodomonas_salina.1
MPERVRRAVAGLLAHLEGRQVEVVLAGLDRADLSQHLATAQHVSRKGTPRSDGRRRCVSALPARHHGARDLDLAAVSAELELGGVRVGHHAVAVNELDLRAPPGRQRRGSHTTRGRATPGAPSG